MEKRVAVLGAMLRLPTYIALAILPTLCSSNQKSHLQNESEYSYWGLPSALQLEDDTVIKGTADKSRESLESAGSRVVRFESNINGLAHTRQIGIASVYYAPEPADGPRKSFVHGKGPPKYGYQVMHLPPTKMKAVNETLLLDRLQISAQLRTNLVTIFGRILFTPDLTLSLDLYASLFDIYESLRTKTIRTTELLRTASQVANKPTEDQFLAIFTAISAGKNKRNIINCAQDWVNFLLQSDGNFLELLMQAGGEKEFNLMENIPSSQLNSIEKHLKFSTASQHLGPRVVFDKLGHLWGSVVGSLLDGTLNVSLPIVASMIQHLPLYRFQPEADEALKFLVDVLNENRHEMRALLNFTDSKHELECPYHIVKRVLANIVLQYHTDSQVNYAALVASHHFTPPEGLYEEKRFIQMYKILNKDRINFPRLFSYIQPGEYPEDVINSRDGILAAIDSGEIDMEYVLIAFVKHDYIEPLDMLIAIIDRIRRRAMPSNYLRDHLAAVNSHIKLKYAVIHRERRSQMQFADLVLIFDGFRSLSDNTRLLAKRVLEVLLSQPVIWGDVIEEFAVHRTGRPRFIARQILLLSLKKGLIPESKAELIENLLSKLDDDGDPILCPVCAVSQERGNETTATDYPGRTSGRNIDSVNMDSLIAIIEPKEDPRAVRLIHFLNSSHLAEVLGQNFKVDLYPTRGILLKAILRNISKNKLLMKDELLYDSVVFFLKQVPLTGQGADKWVAALEDQAHSI